MFRFLASWVFLGLLTSVVSAQIPLQVNHQGLVRVNGVPFDGTGVTGRSGNAYELSGTIGQFDAGSLTGG